MKQIFQGIEKNRTWLGFMTLILVFVFYFPVMENHTQSFKFVDEDEYMVVASLMNRGKRLYRDISTNHQPVTYIASQVVQAVSEPANVFMLIKRHREAVFVWSFGWSLLLYLRFGWKAIPGIFVFEAIKYFILGNEFVAEALVAYPMVYLGLSSVELLYGNKPPKDDKLFGATSVVSVLLLLPLVVPVMTAILIRYIKLGKKMLKGFAFGMMVALLVVFIYIPPTDYFRETIFNNYLFAMPAVSEIKSGHDLVKVVLFMPRSLITGSNLLSWWTRWFSTTLMVYLAIKIIKNVSRKRIIAVGLLVFLITLNLRVFEVGSYFYRGFHLLPWLAVACVTAFFIIGNFIMNTHNKIRWFYITVTVVFMGILLVNSNSPIMATKDTATEHYVQFAPVATASQIINLFKSEDDTLIVLPNEVLINWITGLDTADMQVTYYDWQFQVPLNRNRFYNMLAGDPPDFIVYTDDKSDYSGEINILLESDYFLLYRYGVNGDGFAGVYMRNTKLANTTEMEWKELLGLPIDIPETAKDWYEENY